MPDALGPCPSWCSGAHPTAHEDPVDQAHDSEPVQLDTGTRLGTVETLQALLCKYPNSESGSRDVHAVVDLGACDYRPMSTADLEALAAGLEAHAARLRQLGQQLMRARVEDGCDPL